MAQKLISATGTNISWQKQQGYDSIAISGHKFFGIDEPCGLFLATKEVIKSQTAAKVEYLHNDMPLISCSRSGGSMSRKLNPKDS